MNRRRFFSASAAMLVGSAALSTFKPIGAVTAGPVTTDSVGDQVQQLPKGQLPEFAHTDDTRQLYRYAVEHADELQYIPCTCGCANIGHQSNRDCYVKSFDADGSVTFTSHAAT